MGSARSSSAVPVAELVRSFERACNADGLEEYAAMLAPDVEARMGDLTSVGREAVVRTFATTKNAFPDLVVTFTHVVISGNEVAAELVERGTHTAALALPTGSIAATGRRMELKTAAFVRFGDDGLIRSIHDYIDRAAFREQLGL